MLFSELYMLSYIKFTQYKKFWVYNIQNFFLPFNTPILRNYPLGPQTSCIKITLQFTNHIHDKLFAADKGGK